jgi:hypothetical protein
MSCFLLSDGQTASFFFCEQLAFCHDMNKSQRPGAEEWRQIIDEQRPSGLTVAA